MSDVEHTERARWHLTYGYYSPAAAGGSPYVICPDCRSRVSATVVPWAKPGQIRRALVVALAEHLRDYCDERADR